MSGLSYDEACAAAATDQGLDPICEALRDAQVPHEVDQTGGFIMCIRIVGASAVRYCYLTRSEIGSGVMICEYDDDADAPDAFHDGIILADDAEIGEAVLLAQHWLRTRRGADAEGES